MIEITNRKKFPVSLVVRSKTAPRSFTILNLPGVGKGKNVVLIEDERNTEYVARIEKMGIISTKYTQPQMSKGE